MRHSIPPSTGCSATSSRGNGKLVLAGLWILIVSGCARPEATTYLSAPTPDDRLSLLSHSYEQEVRICDEILAKDPKNQYARANRDLFQRQIDIDEGERAEYQKWWDSLGTERRVQFNDWVRYYTLDHWHLDVPREDAVYKATQLYGKPAVPPLVPRVLSGEPRDALETIRATFGR